MERQVMRARLLRLDDAGRAWVEVPELGVDSEIGPLEVFEGAQPGDDLLVASLDGVQDDIAIVGKRGGEDGGSGGGPGDPGAFFEQTFATPALQWLVEHGLGRLRPDVVTTDPTNDEVFGDVVYLSTTNLRVDWSVPMTGTVTVSL